MSNNSNQRSGGSRAVHRIASPVEHQNAIESGLEMSSDTPAVTAVKGAKKGLLKKVVKQIADPRHLSAFLRGLPRDGEVYNPHEPVNQLLQQIIGDLYYTTNFQNAITAVASQNIPELKYIKSLSQFYYYLDRLVKWIPGIRHWEWNGEILHERTPYLRITQFYYYFNQPDLVALQSPVEPLEGEDLSPISAWLRDFAISWGSFLDTPRSAKNLASFKYAPEYAWQDYEKAPEDYETFNAYFARTFKNINVQRPVAQPDNDRIVVFPAESTFVGQWTISTPVGPPLEAPASIVVKHIEWPIPELLADLDNPAAFEGGILCHSFLNTYDYHRQHSPVAGKIIEAKFIPGQVYLEVNLEGDGEDANGDLVNTVIPQRYLDAEDPTGYQFVQCRGLMVIESAIGKVAVLPMGMAQVSSVVFVEPGSHKPIELSPKEKQQLSYEEQVDLINQRIQEKVVGQHIKKGEMISYFQFGGSDCVMLFERESAINVTAFANVHYPIRSQYAVSNRAELKQVPK